MGEEGLPAGIMAIVAGAMVAGVSFVGLILVFVAVAAGLPVK